MIEIQANKSLALFSYLAITARPHPRPALAGLLWGGMPETRARDNLSKVLSTLRCLFGDYLTITRQTVAFNEDSDFWLDVAAFEAGVNDNSVERLQEAVRLYRGDFLDGFYVRNALEFEHWVLAQQARLKELVLQALHTLASHFAGQGNTGRIKAIQYTRRLLRLEPWREEAHRQMMRLLALTGQRTAALVQYESCRQVLAEELGVEPGVETTALYASIRDGPLSWRAREPGGKGEDRPSVSHAPVSPSPGPPAFLLSASPLLPHPHPSFVGRKRQLAQLNNFLDGILTGQGQVVFITGEGGSGKTALLQEFARQAQEREPNLIVACGNCNAFTGVGDPYLPFREILALLIGDVEAHLTAGAINLKQARRLRNLIPHSVPALLNAGPDLLDIFIPGRPIITRAEIAVPEGADWLIQLRWLMDQKEAGRSRTDLKQDDLFEQYTKVLKALALETPLLLTLDDLQWADAGSINLLFHLGRRLQHSPIMILGVFRQTDVTLGRDGKRHPLEPVVNEFQGRFGQIHVDLRQTEDRQFVEAMLDIEPNRLGSRFREALYQQTRGHALFTIETLHDLQERGDLTQDEAGRWIEGSAVDWKSLPARVEGIIGERISRLPVKLQETLKVASVEGETFTAEVVALVRTTSEPEMVRQLSGELDKQHRLVTSLGSELLEPSRQRLSRYRFRHILFQKYLYESLDNVERVYLHEQIGQLLEQLHRGHTEEVSLQLAWHFQAAGFTIKAVNYLREAGERAVRLSANEAAINHLTRGLGLLQNLPDTDDRLHLELDLLTSLGPALIVTKGYAAPEVEQIYVRARELCQQIGTPHQLFQVLTGLWQCSFVGAKFQRASELAEQIFHHFRSVQEPAVLLTAHWAQGTTFYFMGELTSARDHLEQAIALYDSQQHHDLTFSFGQDPRLFALLYLSHTLWLLGYPDQALKLSGTALNLTKEAVHPYNLAITLSLAAVLYYLRRTEQAAQHLAQEAITLSTQHDFAQWIAHGVILRGWALVRLGQGEEEIFNMGQAMDAWRATGAMLARPVYSNMLAEAYRIVGQVEEGLTVLVEALAIVRNSGERWTLAETYRLKGDLLLLQSADEGQAEHYFHKAIDVARQQSAKSWELRTAISLSRLWRKQGKQKEAYQMLEAVYNGFTEGFDTPDLKEARALLEELS